MKRSILVLLPIILVAGMLAISGCKKKATYTVTFDPNGGSGTMQPQLFVEGEKQPLAYNAFYYDGFSFSGWSDSRFGSSQFTDGQIISVESDMILYAQWTANQGTQGGNGQGGGAAIPTFEYVDLGLPSGTLWATCNIGASKAEDYGSYFAWGEISAKASYDLDNYTLYNGSYTKYNGYDYTTLEDIDDAATAIWGSGWRMPTRTEMNELFNNCSCSWSTVNNIGGYRFTANNGKFIFLPAAGYRIGGDLNDATLCGYYWTSSLYNDYNYDNAYCRSFQQNNSNTPTYKNRYYGMTIRPVHSRIESPTVNTNSATNITANAATFEGYVANNGGANITACGFQYGRNYSNLTMEITSTMYGNNSFTATLSNLEPNTTYYYKAYATNSAGTGYGEVRSFTTSYSSLSYSDPSGYVSGYGYVNLGLPSGTKWATCNIGANSPTGYGNYYAWGETYYKNNYSSSNYTYSDNPTTLPSSADVASYNWGYYWRMPTYDEMNELKNNCTITGTTQNGVDGCLFTGPNGNSIFLPAAGFRSDSELSSAGSFGVYWSNSLYTGNTDSAWYLCVTGGVSMVDCVNRYMGFSVRAVCVQ